MHTVKKLNKPWWVSKSQALLQQYAETHSGVYVRTSFKGWKYTGQHVRKELKQGIGALYVTLADAGSDSSKQWSSAVKFCFMPRRKLEFSLKRSKHPLALPFHPELRSASLPHSAMNKTYHAKATHPGLLRLILKQEGLYEALEHLPGARVKLRIKGSRGILTVSGLSKKPDLAFLEAGVKVALHFIEALHEHGFVREK
ncbi:MULTISPECIES: hypothetical protein [Paenibacillus]|uniref:hypothetical protein n=1 Tax=Paenibacillus TaxID=44249 RepID=UPI002FE34593